MGLEPTTFSKQVRCSTNQAAELAYELQDFQ